MSGQGSLIYKSPIPTYSRKNSNHLLNGDIYIWFLGVLQLRDVRKFWLNNIFGYGILGKHWTYTLDNFETILLSN